MLKLELPKRLPLLRLRAGTHWMRIHVWGRGPLWFGPVSGGPPVNRFDDPRSEFGVCYLGATVEACFAETFLRNPPVRILALADLAARAVATFEARREIRVVPLYGASLARLGVTAEVAAGSAYDFSQAWSRALWEHSDLPDGVAYRSRHDDSTLCAGLYDRSRDALRLDDDRALTEDRRLLERLTNRYGLGLTR